MRILDEDADKSLEQVTLLLTRSEMLELADSITLILGKKDGEIHTHVPGDDFQKEITLAIYDPNDYGVFSERCHKLIKFDE